MPASREPPPPRVNLRMIAARAGVSLATVSFALRRSPRIPEETRKRVLQVAEALGYRPDPELAKLMHHLRARRRPAFQSTLCALTTLPDERWLPYITCVVASATATAEALGYKLIVMKLDDATEQRPDLQRMLISRGVEGLLLLPMLAARSFEKLLDWSRFTTVAATNGVLAPRFHRVVPHQFGNTRRLCEELAGLGYRRIGLVAPWRHDLTAHHNFSAAVVWQNAFGGTEQVNPLLFEGETPSGVKAWFARERPDAIITAGEAHARLVAGELGLRVPGPVGFATINKPAPSIFAGVEERPREIGATAVRLLASLLQHGEKGIPAVPAVTMITGEWVPGKSVRRVRAKAGKTVPASRTAAST